MNKEKTAMQMLIEHIDARLANYPSGALMYALETVKIEAKSLLQKEQEQIEKAFDSGYSDGIVDAVGLDKYKDANGNEYYQSKYGV